MLEQYYVSGLSIPLGRGLGRLHQPTLKEILESDTTVDEIVQPFLFRIDLLDIPQEQLEDFLITLVDFDLFFLKDNGIYLLQSEGKSAIDMLIKSLKILYNTQDVKLIYKDQEIKIGDEVTIDRNNYSYLADVVLEMFQKTKPVKEKPKVFKSKYKQQIWEKLQKHRKEQEKKKAFNMADIINVVVHATGYVPYKEVMEMTYYQLVNSYGMMMQIEGYKEYVEFKTSPKFEMKDDRKHWLTSAKVTRSAIQ